MLEQEKQHWLFAESFILWVRVWGLYSITWMLPAQQVVPAFGQGGKVQLERVG